MEFALLPPTPTHSQLHQHRRRSVETIQMSEQVGLLQNLLDRATRSDSDGTRSDDVDRATRSDSDPSRTGIDADLDEASRVEEQAKMDAETTVGNEERGGGKGGYFEAPRERREGREEGERKEEA
eukprot:3934254-Rhodomonas_salina.1